MTDISETKRLKTREIERARSQQEKEGGDEEPRDLEKMDEDWNPTKGP